MKPIENISKSTLSIKSTFLTTGLPFISNRIITIMGMRPCVGSPDCHITKNPTCERIVYDYTYDDLENEKFDRCSCSLLKAIGM